MPQYGAPFSTFRVFDNQSANKHEQSSQFLKKDQDEFQKIPEISESEPKKENQRTSKFLLNFWEINHVDENK